jgi:hypothetical protein
MTTDSHPYKNLTTLRRRARCATFSATSVLGLVLALGLASSTALAAPRKPKPTPTPAPTATPKPPQTRPVISG